MGKRGAQGPDGRPLSDTAEARPSPLKETRAMERFAVRSDIV